MKIKKVNAICYSLKYNRTVVPSSEPVWLGARAPPALAKRRGRGRPRSGLSLEITVAGV